VSKGLGPNAIREHERELDQAFDFISKSQTMIHEALNRTLDRYPLPYAEGPKIPAKRGKGQAWKTTQGPNFQAKHGLSDDDVQHGQGKFLKATADIILPRQQAAMWLELCKLRKKGTIPCWESCLLVSDCGSSVGWLCVARDMFPCLRPRTSYLILEQGEAKLAKGALCLALQGIGTEEAEAFSLLMEEDGMLRQLAGNAFCANI